jgi:hypothetical protein
MARWSSLVSSTAWSFLRASSSSSAALALPSPDQTSVLTGTTVVDEALEEVSDTLTIWKTPWDEVSSTADDCAEDILWILCFLCNLLI